MANLKFYSGTTYKSDLPFAAIDNPGCMAVRDNGNVHVGAGVTGGQMVVKATTADDYAAWEDLTDSLDTASPIKALETT